MGVSWNGRGGWGGREAELSFTVIYKLWTWRELNPLLLHAMEASLPVDYRPEYLLVILYLT